MNFNNKIKKFVNRNWQNLWLNEGFTVFLERKVNYELFGKDFY